MQSKIQEIFHDCGERQIIPVIMGPTASGKSALALEIARCLNGEIISVDSMQLYRGLAIGTAQPTGEERREVPHHLVGILDFSSKMDVYEFCRMADTAIADIRRRGKLPILAGGTGFYLKALLYGLDDLPGDKTLRAELDAEFDREDAEEALSIRLKELDPDAAEKFSGCRRRMIRALEVRLLTGVSILELQKQHQENRKLRYQVSAWRIDRPPEELKKRIADRVDLMLEAGWIDEAEEAVRNGILDSPTAWQALGYRQISEYFEGRYSFDTMREKIITATWQFARRQRTWFSHQHPESRIWEL